VSSLKEASPSPEVQTLPASFQPETVKLPPKEVEPRMVEPTMP
jgi:hypothetical protein